MSGYVRGGHVVAAGYAGLDGGLGYSFGYGGGYPRVEGAGDDMVGVSSFSEIRLAMA